jgi:hypothetical protein
MAKKGLDDSCGPSGGLKVGDNTGKRFRRILVSYEHIKGLQHGIIYKGFFSIADEMYNDTVYVGI